MAIKKKITDKKEVKSSIKVAVPAVKVAAPVEKTSLAKKEVIASKVIPLKVTPWVKIQTAEGWKRMIKRESNQKSRK